MENAGYSTAEINEKRTEASDSESEAAGLSQQIEEIDNRLARHMALESHYGYELDWQEIIGSSEMASHMIELPENVEDFLCFESDNLYRSLCSSIIFGFKAFLTLSMTGTRGPMARSFTNRTQGRSQDRDAV